MEISHVRTPRLPVSQTVERDIAGDQRATAAVRNETTAALQPVPAKSSSSATENRRDPDSGRSLPDGTGLRISVDPDARQIVYETVDTLTGVVVVQTPDKAMLRQRAYVIQMQDALLAEKLSSEGGSAVARSV